MNLNNKPLLSPDFLLHKNEEGNEYYLFNIVKGDAFQINEPSYDFLALCNGQRDLREIFYQLKETYSIDIDTLQNDFEKLIEQWVTLNAIILGD